MTEQTSQIERPFQADHFSLLKLSKRPKNARVMAILRYDLECLEQESPKALYHHAIEFCCLK